MCKYKWTAFVRIKNFVDNQNLFSNLVDRVEFGLDPSFKKEKEVVTPAKGKHATIVYNGWGEFWMPITVHFKPNTGITEPRQFEHHIYLKGSGKWQTFNIYFDKKKLDDMKVKVNKPGEVPKSSS